MKFDDYKVEKGGNELPLLLWNHRWEHDKNPEAYFDALIQLSQMGSKFNLAVLGEEFKQELPCFTKAREILKPHIVQFGFTDSFEDYAKWLWKADVLPVTSIQDFFGASIMEAVYCQTMPLLPKRLTYPELFLADENLQIFYNDSDELIDKLTYAIQNISETRKLSCQVNARTYDWANMAKEYDGEFVKFLSA